MTVNDGNGRQAEDAVAAELGAAGWEVLNLNTVAGNWPLHDLVARRGDATIVVQVRGKRNDSGEYTTYPDVAHRAALLGEWLGLPSLFAFWHLPLGAADAQIRFATAAQVAALAETTEASYPDIVVRYHVWLDLFDIGVHRIGELLDRPSRPLQPPDDASDEEAA